MRRTVQLDSLLSSSAFRTTRTPSDLTHKGVFARTSTLQPAEVGGTGNNGLPELNVDRILLESPLLLYRGRTRPCSGCDC